MTQNKYGYIVGMYFDNSTGRSRWAVVGPTDVWYFPKNYGKRAAKALCLRLNRLE